MRNGDYTEKEGRDLILGLMESTPMMFEAQSDLIPAALDISIREVITVYDALFIELARRRNIVLVTSDRRQAEVCAKMKVSVEFVE